MDTIKSISSLVSGLAKTESTLKKKFAQLSSGSRITSASDDPAGLAVAEALKADAATRTVASRNIQDAVSAAQIADASFEQIGNINNRLAELATQAANGTLSDEQRQTLNTEYQQLVQEQQRIGETTQFNGIQLIGGSDVTIQAGNSGESSSQLTLPTGGTVTLAGGDILSQSNAQAALQAVQGSIEAIAQTRGNIGAAVSRFEVADANNRVQRDTALEAEARIRDQDIAQGIAEKTASEIRQQTTTALIAQAGKINKDSVLRLLA